MTHHRRLLSSLGFAITLIASSSGCLLDGESTNDSLESFATDGTSSPGGKADDVAASCAALEADPYIFTGVAQGGKHAGQCLDTTMFRAVRTPRGQDYRDAADRFDFPGAKQALDATGDPIQASTRYALAANVRHAGDFWLAEIPLVASSIEAAYFLVEEFELPVAEQLPPSLLALLEQYLPEEAAKYKQGGGMTSAHGMMRLTFRDTTPILVKPQLSADPTRGDSFHELVLSVHAVGVIPGEYDPMEGMVDAYGTARGLYSLEEKVAETITGMGHSIRQWRLDLSSDTARKVLLSYLARSTEAGLGDPYNTLRRNCGSELFESLEAALGRTVGIKLGAIESIDEIPPPLIFPTIGRHYPKYAEQGLVGLSILPLRPGEQPDPYGRVDPEQIDDAYRPPTLNEQIADGSARLD